MENRELEEKVMIMEELIQGFIKRIDSVETETQAYFKSALVHYKQTLDEVAERLEKASQPQENNNFIRQIEELKSLIATMPKVFTVKNSHHFGAWSKSFIMSVTLAFLVTTCSLGTALYLNGENDKLKGEAFKFWLVKALYPDVSLLIEKRLKEDGKGFIDLAEKAMTRQQTVLMAGTEANEAEKAQKSAKEKLNKLKSKHQH